MKNKKSQLQLVVFSDPGKPGVGEAIEKFLGFAADMALIERVSIGDLKKIEDDCGDSAGKTMSESQKKAQRLSKLTLARSVAIQATELQSTIEGDLPKLLAYQAYLINQQNNGI